MPTLLAVNSYYYRRDGAEAVYFDHNQIFEKNGWDVIPFAMQHPQNEDTPWGDYFVDEMEMGRDYGFWGKVSRVPKVIYSWEAQAKIKALCSEVHPDICHCHSIYHHLSPSILPVLTKLEIPVVMTLHDLKIACPAYYMHNANGICESCKGGAFHNVLLKRCIKGSVALSALAGAEALVQNTLNLYRNGVGRFVSPSQFYIEKLVEWGWDRKKFVHIPNPVDLEGFHPNFTAGSSVLYFGRLSPEKGLSTLVRAAGLAGVPLRIAGDGPLASELRQLANQIGTDVRFLGRLTVDKLVAEIQASRITVLPSEWYENAPMSILESYAVGKPVVAANIGGNPELVRERETGWLFESGNVSELAEVLSEAISRPDKEIEGMGRAARALVEASFNKKDYLERMLQLYRGLSSNI